MGCFHRYICPSWDGSRSYNRSEAIVYPTPGHLGYYWCIPLYNLQASSATSTSVWHYNILTATTLIWELQMTWQKRLGVSVIFDMSLLAMLLGRGEVDDDMCSLLPVWLLGIPKIVRESKRFPGFKRALGITMKSQSAKAIDRSVNFGGISTTISAYPRRMLLLLRTPVRP
ncbi:hypothetical protein F5Y00DRAFT_222866 [Daldinia vernicosa]|uniref:uncharacterized protein n=1 Tax=Daldinia vernicosa TaxID=114800 RepID=UPI002007BD2C|nr:uncharacterized protein F5Y00DRAFT_222866 [Daldinia vernicosa]KAI0854343.1 hypothetical protein F5Y00DRAFT_222866 [Daldinia vernicosa]